MIYNPSAHAGAIRDTGLIPGSGKSPGGENGTPPQCSCLENPTDRGAWWAAVYGVTESQTGLAKLSSPHTEQEKTLYHGQAGEASVIFGSQKSHHNYRVYEK